MKISAFEGKKEILGKQYKDVEWIESSGASFDELRRMRTDLQASLGEASASVIKARTFEMLLQNGQIAIEPNDIFQDKLNAVGIMSEQCREWLNKYYDTVGKERETLMCEARNVSAFAGNPDFGHTSTNTRRLLELGVDGLLKSVISAENAKETLTEEQTDFYISAKITLKAFQKYILRLAGAVRASNPDNADCLQNIAVNRPENMYEAMQLLVVYFYLHEFISGARVRTLGRLDMLLYPYYRNDIKNGNFTKSDIKELMRYFLYKLWAMDVPYDLPFQLGGVDSDGDEITNELSYLIVEIYTELDIYSPKLHIRVSDKTPTDFIKLVLRSIREGKSSFVFANDNVVIPALMSVGATERDAKDYTFIGCYEPAVYAHELGCTCNGGINAGKMIELVLMRGRDLKTGSVIGPDTGVIKSYEDFLAAVRTQIKFAVDTCVDTIVEIEKHYMEIYPDALLSSLLEECVESGRDAYAGGARYNNTSLNLYCIATLVDSIAAVKKLVFDDMLVSFEQLVDILKNNWQGNELLRRKAQRLSEKYGNNNPVADEIMVDISEYFASLVTGRPNGRGGVFKASCFSIDQYVYYGHNTMATPDGRLAGEVLSKNLSPTTGMDRKGITALISSVTKLDLRNFPNGSVLDIILHPSAVKGDEGIDAFYGILKTYFAKGGMALHGNVFNATHLKKAQKDPEKYSTLQVRVCGWNAYFVNLTRDEQDDFIRKTEHLAKA